MRDSKKIEKRFEHNSVDNITYKQWMATDRSTLETTALSCSNFLESFTENLNILLHQSFTGQQHHVSIKN
jgi:hypothetical protein